MKVKVLKAGGEAVFEGTTAKTPGVVFQVEDGKAHIQVEVSGTKLVVSADGGTSVGGWEVELTVPRVKEPASQ